MRRLPPSTAKPLAVWLAAVFVWLVTGSAHAESNIAEVAIDASARMQARAHLDFRITVLPSIALSASTALSVSAKSTSEPGTGTHSSPLFRSRRGVTSQMVVIDSTSRYTVVQP